jgi:hypothetical protein
MGGISGELIDSTHLAADPEGLRSRIRSDGYVFLRSIIDTAVVAEARLAVLAGLSEGGWLTPGVDPDSPTIAVPPRSAKQPKAWQDPGYRAAASSAAFNAIPYASGIVELMRHMMGTGAFCYPFKHLRVVYPAALVSDYGNAQIHSDYTVIGVQDMFTTWVPLMEIPRELGGLAVLPSSHRAGLTAPTVLREDESGWATADYRPGDVLAFHCLTSHAAQQNRTDRLRLSGDFRWQVSQDPVPAGWVFDPNSDGTELWSPLFARTAWWRPVPANLAFFPGPRSPIPGAPLPRSRYVDAPGVWGPPGGPGGTFTIPPD